MELINNTMEYDILNNSGELWLETIENLILQKKKS